MTVAMDAMAVAIHIKYALSLNRHLTSYYGCPSWRPTNSIEALKGKIAGAKFVQTRCPSYHSTNSVKVFPKLQRIK